MKIAYISQAYPPMVSGASIMLKMLADGMSIRGHTVMVLAASDRGDAYIQQEANMRVVRLKSIRNPKRAYQKFVLWSFNDIYSKLKAFKPDLIHTHDVLSLGIFGLVSGKKMDIPVIATIHQLPWFVSAYLPDIPGLKPSIEGCLWNYGRWLNNHCQMMIVPTETISRTVNIHGGFRPVVISNGIDFQNFTTAQANPEKDAALFKKYHLDPDLPIILHVGRLDVDKKVEVVIRTAAGVMERTPTQLLVVGDGECRANLMDLSRQLGIDEYSHFPGFVDLYSDLPDLYRLAIVFTTASEIETQGLVLLEAMAAGLPVVAVDATCIHEVVKHQTNGYLFPPGDENGITEGLIDILQNPTKAKQMGEAGRSIVKAYSTQNSLDRHENLYRKMIRGYQPTRESRSLQKYLVHGKNKS